MAETTNGTSSAFAKMILTLAESQENFISSKTVFGEPLVLGDTTLIPLLDVAFGMGVGAMAGDKKKNNAGAMGGKMSVSAVLVLKEGTVRMVSAKGQDHMMKILDMIPDYVDKFLKSREAKKDPEKAAAREEARQAAAEDLKKKLEE